jgi:hypothetical protein
VDTKRLMNAIALASGIGLFSSTPAVSGPSACVDGGWTLFGFAEIDDCHKATTRNGALVWNISEDFLVYPYEENPNRDQYGNLDTWWFMTSPTLDRMPDYYVAFPHYTVVDDNRENWDNDEPIPPNDLSFPFVGISGQKYRTVVMHPTDSQLAVLRWESPINGNISLKCKFRDLDGGGGDGIDWYVEHQSTSGVNTLAEGTLDKASPDYPREATLGLAAFAVSEGDVIDFIVHPRKTSDYDSTNLTVTIIGPLPTE